MSGRSPSPQSLHISITLLTIVPCLQENDENSNSGLSSFDTIYFAALQVFIVSSANGVRDFCLLIQAVTYSRITVDTRDVSNDGLRVLHLSAVLHRLHHCAKLLAHQPLRCCDHQYFLCHPKGYSKKCFRCRPVS